ncbi:MAG TPA: thioredoxin [Mogibacterium sp.]|nr:thioredoxin [Mogibacterium sp.]
MVTKLNSENYEKEVMQSEGTVMVDFYANWCGPCRAQAPIIEQLAKERTDVKFFKVDVDESVQIAAKLGISSIPTIMVVKDGKVEYLRAGMMQKSQLNALL